MIGKTLKSIKAVHDNIFPQQEIPQVYVFWPLFGRSVHKHVGVPSPTLLLAQKNNAYSKVQAAVGNRKEQRDDAMISASLLATIPDTVCSTSMLTAQLVNWTINMRKQDAHAARSLV